MSSLLVVAGEASGDRAAAAVVDRLTGVDAFGLGGAALASRGVELLRDLRATTALGLGETATRGFRVLQAWRSIVATVRKRKPFAALLVDYAEFNARLAPWLHRLGVRVLLYGAPQVWAWRPGRTSVLGASLDRLAVVLPFEERIWRNAGVDADYVGHPALESNALDRSAAREALGMTPYAAAVALLPGSRPHEVRRLLVPMLQAYAQIRADRASVDARVLVAPSLDGATRKWVDDASSAHRVATFNVDPNVGAIAVLRAFDASLCASGTASLEATLARAVPVITYRVGFTTELAARWLVRTPHVALPNILLGDRVFAELLQRDARASTMAKALGDALDQRPALLAACDAVESALGDRRTPSRNVAAILAGWRDARSPHTPQ